MNKKVIYIAIGIALFMLLFIVAIVLVLRTAPSNQQTNRTNQEQISITTVPLITGGNATILVSISPSPAVESSNPRNGQTNVPINTKTLAITLTESTVAKSEDVNILIDPPTQFSYKARGANISLTFLKPLQSGTLYSYSVTVNNSSAYIGSFTTSGPTPSPLPGSEPPGYFEAEREQQQQDHPDVYLSNLTPYEAPSFTIRSEYVESVDGFAFIVTRKGNAQLNNVQVEVKQWMLSEGISEAQFNELDIRYQ